VLNIAYEANEKFFVIPTCGFTSTSSSIAMM